MFNFKKKKSNVNKELPAKTIITDSDIKEILTKFKELEELNWDGSPIEVNLCHDNTIAT